MANLDTLEKDVGQERLLIKVFSHGIRVELFLKHAMRGMFRRAGSNDLRWCRLLAKVAVNVSARTKLVFISFAGSGLSLRIPLFEVYVCQRGG